MNRNDPTIAHGSQVVLASPDSAISMAMNGSGLLLEGAVALGAFFVVGAVFLDGFALDLGSLNVTRPRYLHLHSALGDVWRDRGGTDRPWIVSALTPSSTVQNGDRILLRLF